MAEFESKVYEITVEEHPNADAIELACVGDYRSIIQKNVFTSGDLAAYIPEGAVVPEDVIQELGLEGRLAGKKKDRVKAIKLRGVVSQGLIYPITGKRFEGHTLQKGEDVTELLGLVKYEPPIPTQLSGQVTPAFGATIKYDIENIKKYPDVIQPGENVVITEKLHGTFVLLGLHPVHGAIVSSKGISAGGLIFKMNEENDKNLYIKIWKQYADQVTTLRGLMGVDNKTPFYVLGEIFGKGVQDLHYGSETPTFSVFDVYVGHPGQGHYVNAMNVLNAVGVLHDAPIFRYVPILYVGPFSKEVVQRCTNGNTNWSDVKQIREGCVIRMSEERYDPELGRVILKSVSDDYLLRKGGTEYN